MALARRSFLKLLGTSAGIVAISPPHRSLICITLIVDAILTGETRKLNAACYLSPNILIMLASTSGV